MDNIPHTYPLPPYAEHHNRKPWRVKRGDKIYYQMHEDLLSKYIWHIANQLTEYSRRPSSHIKDTLFFYDRMLFLCFSTEVIHFIKVHQLDVVYPLLKEGIIISLRRNSQLVEMSDLQPYLAVRYQVWTLGSSLDYFMETRRPFRRFSTHRSVRSILFRTTVKPTESKSQERDRIDQELKDEMDVVQQKGDSRTVEIETVGDLQSLEFFHY